MKNVAPCIIELLFYRAVFLLKEFRCYLTVTVTLT